jgi:hypothetical protein
MSSSIFKHVTSLLGFHVMGNGHARKDDLESRPIRDGEQAKMIIFTFTKRYGQPLNNF